MKPEEALKLLDDVVAQVPATRKDHQLAVEATRVLHDLIESTKEKPKE